MEPVPRIRVRRLAPVVVLLALLAACTAAPQPAPTTRPPTPSPAACPESGLAVRPGGLEAAMGLRLLQIVLVNCGAVPRTVQGHPLVRVLGADRELLDVAVIQGSSGIATIASFEAAPAPVTLQPGQRAMAALVWRNTVTDASVRATHGRYLEIAVSGGAAPQVVEPDGGIDLGTTGRLGVAPWAGYR